MCAVNSFPMPLCGGPQPTAAWEAAAQSTALAEQGRGRDRCTSGQLAQGLADKGAGRKNIKPQPSAK